MDMMRAVCPVLRGMSPARRWHAEHVHEGRSLHLRVASRSLTVLWHDVYNTRANTSRRPRTHSIRCLPTALAPSSPRALTHIRCSGMYTPTSMSQQTRRVRGSLGEAGRGPLSFC